MRGVAVWLASPASSFCNGSDVIVSGGVSCLVASSLLSHPAQPSSTPTAPDLVNHPPSHPSVLCLFLDPALRHPLAPSFRIYPVPLFTHDDLFPMAAIHLSRTTRVLCPLLLRGDGSRTRWLLRRHSEAVGRQERCAQRHVLREAQRGNAICRCCWRTITMPPGPRPLVPGRGAGSCCTAACAITRAYSTEKGCGHRCFSLE